MLLPMDGHVHTEWSWDALDGSMVRTCERAVEIGLPAVAFTEHADATTWTALAADYEEGLRPLIDADGTMSVPALDLDGYLECVQTCRDRFPDLSIRSGVELGEPHWNAAAAAGLLAAGQFDRVLGSLHCLALGERYVEVPALYRERPAADVLRDYLAELPRLIASSDAFDALAHIDYPVRSWPADAGPYDPTAFHEEFRHALRVLAESGRALEVNTALPLAPEVVGWWRDEGGDAVTFGSDAHDPAVLARGLPEAAAMVEAHGFRAGRHPYDVWRRSL